MTKLSKLQSKFLREIAKEPTGIYMRSTSTLRALVNRGLIRVQPSKTDSPLPGHCNWYVTTDTGRTLTFKL